MDMAELGAGGGQGDLNEQHELETWDQALVAQLITLCASQMHDHPQFRDVMSLLMSAVGNQRHSLKLGASLFASDELHDAPQEPDRMDNAGNPAELPIDKLLPALAELAAKSKEKEFGQQGDTVQESKAQIPQRTDGLPQRIASETDQSR